MARPIHAIAKEIRSEWQNVNYAAQPYLDAMASLNEVNDRYYADTAASIVRYFLANAGSFRGEAARRIKLELKSMVAGKY